MLAFCDIQSRFQEYKDVFLNAATAWNFRNKYAWDLIKVDNIYNSILNDTETNKSFKEAWKDKDLSKKAEVLSASLLRIIEQIDNENLESSLFKIKASNIFRRIYNKISKWDVKFNKNSKEAEIVESLDKDWYVILSSWEVNPIAVEKITSVIMPLIGKTRQTENLQTASENERTIISLMEDPTLNTKEEIATYTRSRSAEWMSTMPDTIWVKPDNKDSNWYYKFMSWWEIQWLESSKDSYSLQTYWRLPGIVEKFNKIVSNNYIIARLAILLSQLSVLWLTWYIQAFAWVSLFFNKWYARQSIFDWSLLKEVKNMLSDKYDVNSFRWEESRSWVLDYLTNLWSRALSSIIWRAWAQDVKQVLIMGIDQWVWTITNTYHYNSILTTHLIKNGIYTDSDVRRVMKNNRDRLLKIIEAAKNEFQEEVWQAWRWWEEFLKWKTTGKWVEMMQKWRMALSSYFISHARNALAATWKAVVTAPTMMIPMMSRPWQETWIKAYMVNNNKFFELMSTMWHLWAMSRKFQRIQDDDDEDGFDSSLRERMLAWHPAFVGLSILTWYGKWWFVPEVMKWNYVQWWEDFQMFVETVFARQSTKLGKALVGLVNAWNELVEWLSEWELRLAEAIEEMAMVWDWVLWFSFNWYQPYQRMWYFGIPTREEWILLWMSDKSISEDIKNIIRNSDTQSEIENNLRSFMKNRVPFIWEATAWLIDLVAALTGRSVTNSKIEDVRKWLTSIIPVIEWMQEWIAPSDMTNEEAAKYWDRYFKTDIQWDLINWKYVSNWRLLREAELEWIMWKDTYDKYVQQYIDAISDSWYKWANSIHIAETYANIERWLKSPSMAKTLFAIALETKYKSDYQSLTGKYLDWNSKEQEMKWELFKQYFTLLNNEFRNRIDYNNMIFDYAKKRIPWLKDIYEEDTWLLKKEMQDIKFWEQEWAFWLGVWKTRALQANTLSHIIWLSLFNEWVTDAVTFQSWLKAIQTISRQSDWEFMNNVFSVAETVAEQMELRWSKAKEILSFMIPMFANNVDKLAEFFKDPNTSQERKDKATSLLYNVNSELAKDMVNEVENWLSSKKSYNPWWYKSLYSSWAYKTYTNFMKNFSTIYPLRNEWSYNWGSGYRWYTPRERDTLKSYAKVYSPQFYAVLNNPNNRLAYITPDKQSAGKSTVVKRWSASWATIAKGRFSGLRIGTNKIASDWTLNVWWIRNEQSVPYTWKRKKAKS